ncbi:MAG: metallophosphoesterase, partial [Verrucomicrobiae bacterium]|nr:metallophosphoesterase [Verrucomicrobiae bacterium]
FTVVVLSDVHYASSAEQQRPGFETRVIRNPLLRSLVKAYRRHVWVGDPFAHNHLLAEFIAAAGEPDLVVANGDYSCDTAFVGVSDMAAFESAAHCIGVLRERYPQRFVALFGDHELGKLSLFGGVGGLRLASWYRATADLGIESLWVKNVGLYVLVGIVSSLVAFPVFEPETVPDERPQWWELRERHLDGIRSVFRNLRSHQRVILFCHDPTALPFLASDHELDGKLGQIECTVIGHLHTKLVLSASRVLTGIPPITFAGNTVRRMTEALRVARKWRPFNIRLCPSLAGSELLKDGGFGVIELDPTGAEPLRWFVRHLSPGRSSKPGLAHTGAE